MLYFLINYLPEIKELSETGVSSVELITLFEKMIPHVYVEQFSPVREWIDLLNLSRHWAGETLLSGGLISREEFSQAASSGEGFFIDLKTIFGDSLMGDEKWLAYPRLLSLFYRHQIERGRGFVRNFFAYDWTLWVTLIAYRSLEKNLEVSRQLFFEDPLDPVIQQLIKQNDIRFFEFPEGLEGIDYELTVAAGDPAAEMRMLFELRCHYCEQVLEEDPYSYSALLAYGVETILLEHFHEGNKESVQKKGYNLFQQKIAEIQ